MRVQMGPQVLTHSGAANVWQCHHHLKHNLTLAEPQEEQQQAACDTRGFWQSYATAGKLSFEADSFDITVV